MMCRSLWLVLTGLQAYMRLDGVLVFWWHCFQRCCSITMQRSTMWSPGRKVEAQAHNVPHTTFERAATHALLQPVMLLLLSLWQPHGSCGAEGLPLPVARAPATAARPAAAPAPAAAFATGRRCQDAPPLVDLQHGTSLASNHHLLILPEEPVCLCDLQTPRHGRAEIQQVMRSMVLHGDW